MGRPEGALRGLGIAIRYGVAELLTGAPVGINTQFATVARAFDGQRKRNKDVLKQTFKTSRIKRTAGGVEMRRVWGSVEPSRLGGGETS